MDIFRGFDRNFTILAADDLPENLALIQDILESPRCRLLLARNGQEALDLALQYHPDLVLLDVMMPELDGYQVCHQLKGTRDKQLIPVVMITALTDLGDKIRGIEAGADDFLNKPFNVAEFAARVRSLLRLKQITDELENAETVLFSLALGVEAKDPSTIGHCERLARYSVKLGEPLGLEASALKALQRGGILHDIGKLGVPDAILLSPRPLSREDWSVMRQHTLIGERICQPLRSFGQVLPIIRCHHERWDGSGYPDGLRGEEIPLTARILQIVDVFDALCSQRPYKPPLSVGAVLQQLHEEARRGWRDRELTQEFIWLVENQQLEESLLQMPASAAC
ncbi:MAG: response regulator [Acidimicrobiia bacterium]|nr:response regulator [Acidimicrobiia bacterium]